MAHQSLTFIPPKTALADVADRRVLMHYKVAWADDWIPLQNARVDGAAWACAPSFSQAQFSVRHGYGIQPEGSSAQNYPFIDYSRRWIRIEMPDLSHPTDAGWIWIGVADIMGKSIEDSITINESSYDIGESEYVCYGIERLFESHRVSSSLWYDTSEHTSDVGLTFNKGGKPNRSATQRSANNHYYFASENEDTEYWSTRDIVEYMIRSGKGTPVDQASNNDLGFFVSNTSLDMLPNWDAPELETHLVTAHQIISALVNRRRLYTWWLKVHESPSSATVEFMVATFTNLQLDIGNGNNIPANTETIDITLNDDPTTVFKQVDRSNQVDQVVAYGARRRHVCTTTFGVSSGDEWKRGWTSAEVTAYKDAGTADAGYPTDIDDRQRWVRDARNREEHNHVFSRFVLRDTLSYPPSDPDSYTTFFDNVTVEPTLPLLANVDYSGNAINSGNFVFRGNGPWPEREIMVYIKKPGTSPAEYVKLEDVGSHQDIEHTDVDMNRNWSARVRVPKHGKSIIIRVSGGPQHVIGGDDFTPLATIDEDVYGDWDWEEIKATVSFLDERYAEGRYPSDASVPSTDSKRVMRIPAGAQYKQIYVVTNTVVDLDDDGTEVLATNDGFIQDDRQKLQSLARMAFQWYGQQRQVVRIQGAYNTPCHQLEIGQYLTSVTRQGGAAELVGSIITQLSVRMFHSVSDEPRKELPPAQFTLQTSFGELDVVRLGRRR